MSCQLGLLLSQVQSAALLALAVSILGAIAVALDRYANLMERFGGSRASADLVRKAAQGLLVLDLLVLVSFAVFLAGTHCIEAFMAC